MGNFDLRWVAGLVGSVVIGFIALVLEVVGFTTHDRTLWLPAAVLFPAAWIAAVVCAAMLTRKALRQAQR